tara:strand:- start:1126 stop:2892 length:1767 start_codon:yes stop_codon:yes gene_type:complete
MRVGLIGYGYWGKILHSKLLKISSVKFIVTSKYSYSDKLKNVDWVVVATPSQTHYEIVKDCLNQGVNVFCEKSLTLDYQTSKELYDIAEKNGCKLYVDDVFFYRDKLDELKQSVNNNDVVDVVWKKSSRTEYGKFIMSNLYNLSWHDFYLLYECLGDKVTDIKKINSKDKLQFQLKINDKQINFLYDRCSEENDHSINDVSLMHDGNDEDAIIKMFTYVFSNDNFIDNKNRTLFCAKLIDNLRRELFTNVDVIGGGIFGVTCAWMLSKNGYYVNLYEKNDDILSSASFINQYRLHRGYHYPRSEQTALSSKTGEKTFIEAYGKSLIKNIENYYCISSEDSKVDSTQYTQFLNNINLEYEITDVDFINKNSTQLSVKVNENLFNPISLKKICKDLLGKYLVNVKLNTKYVKTNNKNTTVNCTYALINENSINKKEIQFELCEKIVVKLPKHYKNKSVVIMDGPFMCIDPYADSEYHVMGNVVHAIHHTNVGMYPEIPIKYKSMLNSGIIKNPKITNFKKFINSAKKYFDFKEVEHVGSMFTIRAVLPKRDYDDARPTICEINDNTIDVFSGKIVTCVDLAQKIVDHINA